MKRQYDLDWIRVLATLAVFLYHCLMFFNPWPWHVKNNETDPTYITAISLFMSAWLMPIFFAVSDRYLSLSNRWLKYGNQASMPFYVLHQPVIVLLGFLIADVSWSIPLKLIFLIVAAFLIIMVLYEFLIARVSIFRVLFGMKGNKERVSRGDPVLRNHIKM